VPCSCYLGILLGVVSIIAFTILWRYVKVYQSRQYLRQVAFKPPDVPSKKCFGWEMPWCAAAVVIAVLLAHIHYDLLHMHVHLLPVTLAHCCSARRTSTHCTPWGIVKHAGAGCIPFFTLRLKTFSLPLVLMRS
jgi:hypothetical protein